MSEANEKDKGIPVPGFERGDRVVTQPAGAELKLTVTYERWILEKGVKIGVTEEFLRRETTPEDAIDFLGQVVDGKLAEALKSQPAEAAEEYRRAEESTRQAPPPPQGIPERDLDAVQWRPQKGMKGAWVFARERDGSPSNNVVVRSMVNMIVTAGGDVKLYGHTYRLSADGTFLSRYPP